MITERPVHGRPPGPPERAPAKAARAEARRNVVDVLRAYVALTKPRIVELLLVTTVPAMMLAAGGWPDWRLVVVVLVGGALWRLRRDRVRADARCTQRPHPA
jgi:protoheme IX farnesyltransferase